MCDTHVPFNQAVIYRQKIRQLRDTWSIGITVLKPIHSGYFDHTATLGYVSMTHTADLKESGRARSAYSISFASAAAVQPTVLAPTKNWLAVIYFQNGGFCVTL